MTWLLVAAFTAAAFAVGRAWQAVRDEKRIELYIDEIENGIDLIVKQQILIREQRDRIAIVESAWQADRDRLSQRGLL